MPTSDWIQVWIAITLTLTLVSVLGYVFWTKRQADATIRIAKAALQPVLVHWIDVDEQVVKYWNVGMGPALDIRCQLDWQSDSRLAMGIRDEKGNLDKLDLSRCQSPALLVAEYEDVEGSSWHSTLGIHLQAGRWVNGTPSYGSGTARRI